MIPLNFILNLEFIIKKLILLLVSSIFIFSCSKNREFKVIVNNYNHTANPDKVFFNYKVTGNSCGLNWHVVENKLDKKWSIKLVEDINKKYYCQEFSQEKYKNLAVLKEIFKHHKVDNLIAIAIPSFSSLQPDLTWNLEISKNASLNSSWKKYLADNSIGLEQTNVASILKNIINENNIDKEIKNVFKEAGVEIQLHTADKVRSINSNSKVFKKMFVSAKSNKRLLFDADYYWYKVLK